MEWSTTGAQTSGKHAANIWQRGWSVPRLQSKLKAKKKNIITIAFCVFIIFGNGKKISHGCGYAAPLSSRPYMNVTEAAT